MRVEKREKKEVTGQQRTLHKHTWVHTNAQAHTCTHVFRGHRDRRQPRRLTAGPGPQHRVRAGWGSVPWPSSSRQKLPLRAPFGQLCPHEGVATPGARGDGRVAEGQAAGQGQRLPLQMPLPLADRLSKWEGEVQPRKGVPWGKCGRRPT